MRGIGFLGLEGGFAQSFFGLVRLLSGPDIRMKGIADLLKDSYLNASIRGPIRGGISGDYCKHVKRLKLEFNQRLKSSFVEVSIAGDPQLKDGKPQHKQMRGL